VAVVACGALAGHLRTIARRRGLEVEIHALPSLLHNQPRRIAPAVEALATSLRDKGRRVALAYADCGTYGALDEVCERLGLERLAGQHCYDVIGGPERIRRLLEEEPGTYLLTDFLVASFARSVLQELGLDRHPELRDVYFGHYRRAVWLAEEATPALEARARAAAEALGLPLEVVPVGLGGLDEELERLVAGSATALARPAWAVRP
jgi:hypothetical protein